MTAPTMCSSAFERCGVLRVNNISDLFYMAEVLAKQPRAKAGAWHSPHAGGPGVLRPIRCCSRRRLAEIAQETIAD